MLNLVFTLHSQKYLYLSNYAYDSNEFSSLSIEKKQHDIVAFVTNGKEIKCIAINRACCCNASHNYYYLHLVIVCFDLCFRQN